MNTEMLICVYLGSSVAIYVSDFFTTFWGSSP